jgi:hypothetical protein
VLLAPELAWLVTDEAKNGFQFGQLLGQADNLKLWNPIVSAWIRAGEQRSDFFIGGYLSAWHVKKVDLWEQLVENVLANAEVRSLVIGLVWRSGMSDRIAKTLLGLAKQGDIDPKAFRLFVFGGVVNHLPLDVLKGIVDLLLEGDDPNAPDAAMEILDARLRGQTDEMSALSARVERALSSPSFIEGEARRDSNNMLLFRWNAMANRLLDFDPDAGAELAVRCVANFANDDSITAGFRPDSLKFLSNAARAKPAVVWPAVAHRLEVQRQEIGTWHLLNWLRGGRSVREDEEAGLDVIPAPVVFEWVDVDAADRAWLLAEHCPPIISKPGEPPTFARQMLERYGAIEQVRLSLHANNFTGSWSGPASEHFRRKLAALVAHLAVETNANVRAWLKEHRERLESSLAREVERELRESEH